MTQSADTGELPALRTARRAGLIEQVIDQLREQIVAGTWAIGARIPTEAELAQLTGTSRNTVREAVQSLVHAGLLERRPPPAGGGPPPAQGREPQHRARGGPVPRARGPARAAAGVGHPRASR